MKRLLKLTAVLLSLAFLWGCGAEAILLGVGLCVGAGAGTMRYMEGSVSREYPVAFNKSWDSTNLALANLSITVSNSVNEGVKGQIDGVRKDGAPVIIKLIDRGQGVTTISVRVGSFGNRTEAERVHEEIKTAAGLK
jgi:hypothetical protein